MTTQQFNRRVAAVKMQLMQSKVHQFLIMPGCFLLAGRKARLLANK